MLKYVFAGPIRIPSYSMMIVVGGIICNLIAQHSLCKDLKKYREFLLLEAVGAVGAIAGAKALSILDNPSVYMLSMEGFKEAGYSYYGGLFGFLLFAYVICKKCRIDGITIAKDYVYLLPLMHVFWKVGCFLGGCCYGRPYEGILVVCYPEGANCLSNTKVFPSPLAEAIMSAVITLIMLYMKRSKAAWQPVGSYLILYGVARFILEFARYHENQSFFSVAHVYSIIATGIGIFLVIKNNRRLNYE